MNAEGNEVTESSQGYRWIECKSCGGNVGVPSDWASRWLECPECGEEMKVHGELLYRAPTNKRTTAPNGETPREPAKSSQSLENQSLWAFILGIACIVLGWTFLVPLSCWLLYRETWQLAEKEKVPVPVKATVGLVISILFGVTQCLTLLAHLR